MITKRDRVQLHLLTRWPSHDNNEDVYGCGSLSRHTPASGQLQVNDSQLSTFIHLRPHLFCFALSTRYDLQFPCRQYVDFGKHLYNMAARNPENRCRIYVWPLLPILKNHHVQNIQQLSEMTIQPDEAPQIGTLSNVCACIVMTCQLHALDYSTALKLIAACVTASSS